MDIIDRVANLGEPWASFVLAGVIAAFFRAAWALLPEHEAAASVLEEMDEDEDERRADEAYFRSGTAVSRAMTPDTRKARQRALEWARRAGFHMTEIVVTIGAALKAPALTDEQWEDIEEFCAQVSSSTNDEDEQSRTIDIAATIRTAREGQ